MSPNELNVRFVVSSQDLAQKAALYLFQIIENTLKDKGHCTIALSGGRSPAKVFEALAEYRDKIDWHNVKFFWVDERWVGPFHKDSNYKLAKDHLLNAINAVDVFPMEATTQDADSVAQKYHCLLDDMLPKNAEGRPVFDLMLLGMGEDGHVASLFPGRPTLEEKEKFAVADFVPHLNARRLSLTFPVINASKNNVFIVDRNKKKEDILNNSEGVGYNTPLSYVNFKETHSVFFINPSHHSE